MNEKLMGENYEVRGESFKSDAGTGGVGGNYDRRTTFSRLETLSRRFTFERSLTNVIGLDSEEAWTRKLIEDYVAVAEKGVEGKHSVQITLFAFNLSFQLCISHVQVP